MRTISWYYDYYLIYKNKEDGKFYPFGPFDYEGDYKDVLSKSRSFASDLHEEFIDIRSAEDRKALVSEELLKTIHNGLDEEECQKFYEGDNDFYWSYLHIDELPKGDYIKKGYVLIEDIERCEDPDAYFEGFYDVLSPDMYARKLENELKFGRPRPQKDCEGEEYTPHSVADYSFYMWVDNTSKEYDAYIIRRALGYMREMYELDHGDEEIYVLLVQG